MTTLTEIKKDILAKGGEYKKLKMRLNGNDAYDVNNKTYTKRQLIEAFKNGAL